MRIGFKKSLTHLFIQRFSKYLLSTYYVLDIVSGTGEIMVDKAESVLHSEVSGWEADTRKSMKTQNNFRDNQFWGNIRTG